MNDILSQNNIIIGKYFKITDIASNKVIASGRCSYEKVEYHFTLQIKLDIFPLISFDNNYFFISKGNEKYKVEEVPYIETMVDIPKNYIIEKWGNVFEHQTADVYRDYGINELDKEVVSLVDALNKIDGFTTTGSCCGHNKYPLWINVIVTTEPNLFKAFLKKEFGNKFSFEIKRDDSNELLYTLITNCIGEEAYNLANELALKLDKYNNIF